jgi:hypothetical protein
MNADGLIAPGLQSQNISMCSGMNCERIITIRAKQWHLILRISFHFIDLLSETLRNKNFTKALFIMDNVPFHKAVLVR